MQSWGSTKSTKVYAALLRIGWYVLRQSGSHKTLRREGFPDYTWAFHDRVELGPVMLRKIAKHTGLRPEDI